MVSKTLQSTATKPEKIIDKNGGEIKSSGNGKSIGIGGEAGDLPSRSFKSGKQPMTNGKSPMAAHPKNNSNHDDDGVT